MVCVSVGDSCPYRLVFRGSQLTVSVSIGDCCPYMYITENSVISGFTTCPLETEHCPLVIGLTDCRSECSQA